MKRILFVMQSLYNGGAERSLVNLLNELPKDKFDISLLLFKREGMFLKQVPEEIHILDTPTSLKKLFSPVRKAGKYAITKVYGTLRSKKHERKKPERVAYRWLKYYSPKIAELDKEFDIAIAYISGEVMYYVAEKVQAKWKYVWVHNDYRTAGHPKRYDYKYFKSMNGIVSISDECVKIINEEFPEFKSKTYCIPNLTSSIVIKKRSDEFYPPEYKKEVHKILSIGRLREQKGFDIAIEAAYQLKRKGIMFEWYVIGSGELEDELKSEIASKGVSDCFMLIGIRENPYPYIKNCDVFVQPSRWEGKSVVIDEAKILCKPIVVTNYSTVHDQIQEGEEGLIVPMNADGIADGIQKLLEKEELRNGLIKYLEVHEYGNQQEIQKYVNLLDM